MILLFFVFGCEKKPLEVSDYPQHCKDWHNLCLKITSKAAQTDNFGTFCEEKWVLCINCRDISKQCAEEKIEIEPCPPPIPEMVNTITKRPCLGDALFF